MKGDRYRPIKSLPSGRALAAQKAWWGIVLEVKNLLDHRRYAMRYHNSVGVIELGIARRLAADARQLIAACGTRIDARTSAALKRIAR